MTGIEHWLNVFFADRMIARLSSAGDEIHWHYLVDWQQNGFPVSPHLPLHGDIPSPNIERYLRNVLPEGERLTEMLDSFRISRNNVFALVRLLGTDLAGSLVFVPPEHDWPTQEMSFRVVETNELIDRLDNREFTSLIVWDGKPRLSVAGVQEKINVLVRENGELGFGEGALCSTHILKFERNNNINLVLNEFTTMRLAKACGLDVASVELRYFGVHPTLLVKRFDRKLVTTEDKVLRRPLIDGCQLLNLTPNYKYERNFGSGRDVAHIRDGASLPMLFAFAGNCSNPALTRQQILDWVLFNILVFNHDAHGKNISFYVSENGIQLAPFYDMINIGMYPEFDQDTAMALGNEFDSGNVNAFQIADFADSCGLSRRLVSNRLKRTTSKLLQVLDLGIRSHTSKEGERKFIADYDAKVRERCLHIQSEISALD